jgi:ribosomal protein S18 acetylase RimI-like enzyme
MEHSPLRNPEIRTAAENLSQTYLALGRSAEGATTWAERGFTACTGSMEHPICNFAVAKELDGGICARLRQLASQRRCFSLYALPHLESESLLEGDGFALSHKLKVFVGENVIPHEQLLTEAKTHHERLKLADFMMGQFFHKQPTAFRRGIAEATSRATSLRLLSVEGNGRVAGAVMLSEHAGALGIYNLCVSTAFRRRGWGAAIVGSAARLAAQKGLRLTLQCEPNLAAWYETLGFREVGSVSVFGLLRFREVDIMGQ